MKLIKANWPALLVWAVSMGIVIATTAFTILYWSELNLGQVILAAYVVIVFAIAGPLVPVMEDSFGDDVPRIVWVVFPWIAAAIIPPTMVAIGYFGTLEWLMEKTGERKLTNFLLIVLFIVVPIVALIGGAIWYETRPTTYDFGNGARLVIPWPAVSIDQRNERWGVVIQSGVNVTVHNDSDEWRSLTVSFRKPNYGILDTHSIEDLPPKSSKTFGAEPARYEGMHVIVTDYAQKKRDKAKKKAA